jgi:hypothetical protein
MLSESEVQFHEVPSEFPGIAKIVRPSRRKKRKSEGDRVSRGGGGGSCGSSRTAKAGYSSGLGEQKGKIESIKDAQAWGRVAARLGWGLDSLKAEVEEAVQAEAIAAYERRMIQLHGAPF